MERLTEAPWNRCANGTSYSCRSRNAESRVPENCPSVLHLGRIFGRNRGLSLPSARIETLLRVESPEGHFTVVDVGHRLRDRPVTGLLGDRKVHLLCDHPVRGVALRTRA